MTGVFPHTQVLVRALKTNVVKGFMGTAVRQLRKLECFKHALSNLDVVSLFGGAQASAFCAACRACRAVCARGAQFSFCFQFPSCE